ncbi:MAG TPA: sensor histidine kinase [Solirubrobacteraceae bacterium]|nr:sensor histidine kinase [Solirubrobacteraceae bacterium]
MREPFRVWTQGWWGSVDLASRRYPVQFALVVAGYYAAAHLGFAFQFTGPIASIVWLPVGVGIASLYLLGLGAWPAVLVGDLLVNNYSALPVGTAIGQSLGNLGEVVLAAWLMRRFARRHPPLAAISGFERMLVAITAGTIVSATAGTAALYLGHVVGAGSLFHLWRTWWLGDFCGAIIVVPLAIAWLPPPARPWFRGHLLEVLLMLATLVVVSTIAVQVDHSLSYLAFVALIWAGLRFGVRGATLAVAIGAAFTIWGTTQSSGPFAFLALNRSLVDTQLYLAAAAITALSVATLARERERLAESVSESRMRVVVAADTERRRLERDLHDGAQQRLTALSAHLGMASRELSGGDAQAGEALRAAQVELDGAIDELRDLVHGIHPPVLRRFGLARAIEVAAARATIPIELVALPEVRLDEVAETSAYFVVLEALNNAQRYAGAHVIQVRLRLHGDRLVVEVADDGVGGATELDALGLQGLRDRVEAIGGTFHIQSEPGAGTRVSAAIPARVTDRRYAPALGDH